MDGDQNAENEFENDGLKDLLENVNEFVSEYVNAGRKQLEEGDSDEAELYDIDGTMLKNMTQNLKREMNFIYDNIDTDTQAIIDRHVNNTYLTKTLGAHTKLMKLKGGSAAIEKILTIMEIVKKVLQQIIDFLEKNNIAPKLQKILKIILQILQIIDNLLDQINVKFFGGESRIGKDKTFYLRNIEDRMLETYPKWRKIIWG